MENYNNVAQYQERLLKDINLHDLVDMVIEAGRNEDYGNQEVTFSLNDDRTNELLKMEYYINTRDEECIMLSGLNLKTKDVQVRDAERTYRNVDNQLRAFIKEYSGEEIYLDNEYFREAEMEQVMGQENPALYSDINKTINETDEKGKEVTMEPEIITKKRTLFSDEPDIDLKDMSERLRAAGYDVKTKPGGSLLIQDENLSTASITITRKNAYIENAILKTPEVKALYDKMKQDIIDTAAKSHEIEAEKMNYLSAAPQFSGLIITDVTKDLASNYANDLLNNVNHDFSDVFGEDRSRYTYLDKDGDEFFSMRLSYSVRDDDEKSVYPVIIARYGEKYGDISQTFELTDDEAKAALTDSFYKTDIAKSIDEFASVAMKERDSLYTEKQKGIIESHVKSAFEKEFKNLNPQKAEYFSNIAVNYYTGNKEGTLGEFEAEHLKDAPFYREGMLNGNNRDSFTEMFDKIETYMDLPDLSGIKKSQLDLNSLSYTVSKNGQEVFDSNAVEPVVYDREWIGKLVKLEDRLIELRNGPVQKTIDIAHSIARGTKELGTGMVSVYKDGIYSGIEVGKGLESFKEGWDYGKVISTMKAEYDRYAESESTKDKITAIDKKLDIKIFNDEISKNANIYVKAAMKMREACEGMLDTVHSLIRESNGKAERQPYMETVKESFQKYSSVFVESYKLAKDSMSKLRNNSMQLASNIKSGAMTRVDEVSMRGLSIIDDVKKKYNDIVLDARIILSSKEFAKDQIARNINDIGVTKAFENISMKEFPKIGKVRFWDEIDNTIAAGDEAKRIPYDERSVEDNELIATSESVKFQKERNLFVANELNKEVKEIMKENLPYMEAVDRLAETYHNSAMTFNLRNNYSNIKSYGELSQADKELCKDTMEEILKTMPNVEAALERNTEKSELSLAQKDDVTL